MHAAPSLRAGAGRGWRARSGSFDTVAVVSGPQLLVIRHGETEWSRLGRHTGRTDVPLDERGRAEARDAARTLDGWNLAKAYTSPMQRARETAGLVDPICGVVVDTDLLEWDYGVYEGETTPQTRQRVPGFSVWTHEIVGGESVDEVGVRADRFISRFLEEVPVGNAAAFSHGHVLAILIARGAGSRPSKVAGSRSPRRRSACSAGIARTA